MAQERIGQILIGVGALLIVVSLIGFVTTGGEDEPATSGDAQGDAIEADASGGDVAPASTTTTTAAPATTTTTTQAPITTTTTTTTTTTAAPETVGEFFEGYVAAFAAEDAEFLFARLNQATLDRYGADQCRTYLASVVGTLGEIELRSEGPVGEWDYQTSDQSTLVPDAQEVEIQRVVNGQTIIQAVHWKLVDGRFTWFTDCGEPLADA